MNEAKAYEDRNRAIRKANFGVIKGGKFRQSASWEDQPCCLTMSERVEFQDYIRALSVQFTAFIFDRSKQPIMQVFETIVLVRPARTDVVRVDFVAVGEIHIATAAAMFSHELGGEQSRRRIPA
jgi:hypothetical protein